jgi:hypothetical protein
MGNPAEKTITAKSFPFTLPASRSTSPKSQFPRLHSADTCASVGCPASESASLAPSAAVRAAVDRLMSLTASALFRPRPKTEAGLRRRLASFATAALHSRVRFETSLPRRCVPQSQTWRDCRRKHSGAPKGKNPDGRETSSGPVGAGHACQ